MVKTSFIVKVEAATDANALSFSVKESMAERLPYADVAFDNSDNLAEGDYEYYDDLEILMGPSGSESTVFKGVMESIDYGAGTRRSLEAKGRGYAFVLADAMVDMRTFTGKTASEIVAELVTDYGKDGNGTVIVTGDYIEPTATDITRTYKGMPVWDIIMDLCLENGFDAWVDKARRLHFSPRSWLSSGTTIDSTSIVLSIKKGEKAVQVYNRIVVYGDPAASPSQPVGQADDLYSQNTEIGYIKTRIITDSNLTTQSQVDDRAAMELNKYSEVPMQIDVEGIGWESLDVGTVITVTLPSWGVSGQYVILEKEHKAPPSRTVLRLHSYAHSLEGTIIELLREMRRQRAADMSTAIQKRLIRFYETLKVSGKVVINSYGSGTSWIMGYGDDGSALGYDSADGLGWGETGPTELYNSGWFSW